MAAGISSYYDKGGGETADLLNNQWPIRPGDCKPNEYGTSNCEYGVHVTCHAGQSYQAPSKVAGTSKRMGAFYERTGVLQHRTEPGFRDTKAPCVLTEVRAPELGAAGALSRGASGLGNAGSMVLSTPALHHQAVGRPDDTQSQRSRGSAASSRRTANSVQSQASSVPSWAKRAAASERPPWNFNALPMYGRTNETYGNCHRQGVLPQHIQAAGKSVSGFLDPEDLIATLTRPR